MDCINMVKALKKIKFISDFNKQVERTLSIVLPSLPLSELAESVILQFQLL